MQNNLKNAEQQAGLELSPEQIKRRSQRNYGIAGALVLLIIIIMLLTIFKIGPEVMNRPL
jgi:hypothetical protein